MKKYDKINMNFNLFQYESLSSTNDEALRRIASGNAEEGDMICADWQKTGRGQAGNAWFSEPSSNLLCSLILKPRHIEPARQFVLTQAISLALVNVIESFVSGQRIQIKWPNDLLINRKKVAGILFQNSIKGQQIDYAVVGIGINVNQQEFGGGLPYACAIRTYTEADVSIDDFRSQMTESIRNYYQLTFSPQGFLKLEQEYYKRLFQMDSLATYRAHNKRFVAKIIGVDDYGRLLLSTTNGQITPFSFKEIEFLW